MASYGVHEFIQFYTSTRVHNIGQDVDSELAKAAKESVTVGELMDKMGSLCLECEELQKPIQEISKLIQASSSNIL